MTSLPVHAGVYAAPVGAAHLHVGGPVYHLSSPEGGAGDVPPAGPALGLPAALPAPLAHGPIPVLPMDLHHHRV